MCVRVHQEKKTDRMYFRYGTCKVKKEQYSQLTSGRSAPRSDQSYRVFGESAGEMFPDKCLFQDKHCV